MICQTAYIFIFIYFASLVGLCYFLLFHVWFCVFAAVRLLASNGKSLEKLKGASSFLIKFLALLLCQSYFTKQLLVVSSWIQIKNRLELLLVFNDILGFIFFTDLDH